MCNIHTVHEGFPVEDLSFYLDSVENKPVKYTGFVVVVPVAAAVVVVGVEIVVVVVVRVRLR